MKNIVKTENGYILNAADGVRIVIRDEASHSLIGILTTPPTVGQIVLRPLTEEETSEYVAIRRTEKNVAKAAKVTKAAAEKKAADKEAAKKARQEKLAAEKKARRDAEAERAELREISRELKKLETKPEDKKPEEKKPVDPLSELKENLRQAKAAYTACKGTPCEEQALDDLSVAYAMLAEYEANHPHTDIAKHSDPVDPVAEERKALKAEVNAAHEYLNAVRGTDCEEDAQNAVRFAHEKLEAFDKLHNKNTPTEEVVVNNEKEVAPMKDVTNTKRLANVLRQAKLPKAIVEAVINTFTVTDLRPIVFAEAKDALLVIPGVGEKRAETIVKVLQGRIPEPLAIKKLSAEMREQIKAETRKKAAGYSCRTYAPEELWRHILPATQELRNFKPNGKIDALKRELEFVESDKRYDEIMAELAKLEAEQNKKLDELRTLLQKIKEAIFVERPLTVRRSEGRIIRLTRSMVSDVFCINYESKKATDKVAVLNHGVQTIFQFNWMIFAGNKEEGEALRDDFQKKIMNQLGLRGVVAVSKDGSYSMFTPIGASAAYMKEDKVLLGKTKLVKEHEDLFWWGRTMEEFTQTMDTTGAEFWKARANMLRPWMTEFLTEDGRVMKVRRLLVTKDVKKTYQAIKARIIGKVEKNDPLYKDGPNTADVIVGDGAILSIRRLKFQGQCSGALFKGFLADGSSSLEAVCKKHGISLSEILDMMIEGIDGQMHRLGDFDAICGEGCWKGDKVFGSYNEYLVWLDNMAQKYEGIDSLYLLRQAEEVEDEEKVRTLTMSLITQFMWMSESEIRAMSKRARAKLRKDKTFTGAVAKLSGLWKEPEERTAVERLFYACPWLVMSPVIQDYLKEDWERRKIVAQSGKFVTEGQYPYIMQDPVALFEIWVLGMDPNDPTLGILKDGEVSCADVAEGRELLLCRFPANFLTARVRKNRACKKEFASLNGVLVLSVHDLILIIQDGDVDGDEMAVIYNRLAIRLAKRMLAKFDPPVVLFAHGKKGDRKIAGSKGAFVEEIMTALWMAKRYDSVGTYANLAMRCAYLAAIMLKQNRMNEVAKYLLWMSAASTGAILAIDQVKGNDVDLELIRWLENIAREVNKAMRGIAASLGVDYKAAYNMANPFVNKFVMLAKRKIVEPGKHLPMNPEFFVDLMADLIGRDVGEWEDFANEGVTWDSVAAEEALTSGIRRMTVPYGKITQQMIDLLGDNWFKLKATTEIDGDLDKTKETLRKMTPGTTMGLREFIELLWRNEASMANTMEGRQLWEKKEEYYGVCRELLKMLVESADWSKAPDLDADGRWNVLVDNLVRVALELNLGKRKDGTPVTNGIDKKGSFGMFTMRVIAEELLRNALKNNVDTSRFFVVTMDIEGLLVKDLDEDQNAEDEERFGDDVELFEEAKREIVVDTDEIPEELRRQWEEEAMMYAGIV